VSESFANAIGAKVGGQTLLKVGGGTLVPVEIRGMFRLFPTTRTSDGPVVIFNRDRFVSWAQIAYSGYGQVPEPNEVWLDLKPGANNDELVSILTGPRFAFPNYETRARSIASNTENPLIAASGTGILYAAFFAILALVAAALITSLLAAIRRRRVEIAVVRAIGLTRAQLLSMLTLEYAIVFVVGIAAGCGLGLFVSDRMLSFLEVTESGDRVEPPFILETQWLLVALGVVVVLAVFATALWLTARIVGRTSDAAALRADN
jgi:putative ABC transport system permease protein